jgi:hypothetical protein
MSRDSMRALKAENDEKKRKVFIDKIVQDIYNAAVNNARCTDNTSYNYALTNQESGFIAKNITEILERLQELFPDCAVEHTLMAEGRDRKLYNVATLDNAAISFVTGIKPCSYIVIDWSV